MLEQMISLKRRRRFLLDISCIDCYRLHSDAGQKMTGSFAPFRKLELKSY